MRRVVVGRLIGMLGVVLLAWVLVGGQVSVSLAGMVTTTSTSTTSTTPSWDAFPKVSLEAASCSGGSCIAVGEKDLSEQVALPFAERVVAGAWRQDQLPQPSRTTRRMSSLNALSCWSASGCVAVGSFFPSCCAVKPFAERLTGSGWQIQRHVGPFGYQPTALSCPDARFCISVGDGADRAAVVQWNGNRWVRDPTPDPNTDPNTDLESGQSVNLSAVSCTDSRDCVAVGDWVVPSENRYRPLAEIYQDGRWVIQSPKAPKGSSYSLQSVSCAAATECMAIGYSGPVPTPRGRVKRARQLAELWNGQQWIAQRLPRLPGPSVLDSVSCATPASCTVLGNLKRSTTVFAERWNGHSWTRRTTIVTGPQSPDEQPIGFSCSTSRSCTATVWAWPQTNPTIIRSNGNAWTVSTRP